MKRILLIDDMRSLDLVMHPVEGGAFVSRVCRTFDEGLAALKDEGPWDILYLDHDLADQATPERTGYTIICFLEENPQYLPKEIKLVTSNPVGRRKMMSVISRLYG